ncbi:hypothetical protein [Zooshikella sp. RANM57]|uniref:hypothetical protein n=1 Tax=Zooshikella sp. RANM57 TaxID=3425863 RepID=UPI003D6DB477
MKEETVVIVSIFLGLLSAFTIWKVTAGHSVEKRSLLRATPIALFFTPGLLVGGHSFSLTVAIYVPFSGYDDVLLTGVLPMIISWVGLVTVFWVLSKYIERSKN